VSAGGFRLVPIGEKPIAGDTNQDVPNGVPIGENHNGTRLLQHPPPSLYVPAIHHPDSMYVASDVLEESYIPNEMPGREPQLEILSNVLEPATNNDPAGSCWVIGPSGVGKTSTAKYLLRELRSDWDVESTHVKCVGSTRWEILFEIASAHPSVPCRNGLGVDELRERLAVPNEPFVVVLDELGGLEDAAVLEDLGNLEWLSLICIGHDRTHAMEQVPDTVGTLRYADVVEFEPYTSNALFDILDARRETALQTGTIEDAQLEQIIDKAAGSARFGVQALRSAVDLGIERRHTTVQQEDIADCFEHANERIRRQQLESLSHDHHLVYQAIQEHGPLRPVAIYDHYERLASDPNCRQATVNYRRKLKQYDLIEETDCGWVAVDETLAAPRRKPQVA